MIAICALAWNKADHTRRWLDSVRRNSSGHDVRLFLMDNGSTEPDVWHVLNDAQPTKALRSDTNDSIHKQWNILLRLALDAGAEQIILSNNDLIVGGGWLDSIVRELGKDAQAGTRRYFLPNGDFKNPDSFEQDAASYIAALPPDAPRTMYPARAGWCLVFHAEAVRLFLPIPEELVLWYGDDYIHWRLGEKNGYRCEMIIDCPVYHYGSVSFYARDGYDRIVSRDREVWQRFLSQNG